MLKYSISCFLWMVWCLFSLGQNEANHWCFGDRIGLDFNGGCDPVLESGSQMDGFEGCATISDRISGELLFYTNSEFVWNRNGAIMPNSSLVNNGNTITQVLITPKPASDSIYYIFTSEIQSFSGEGLRLHCVDMRLNGGLGGIAFKDSVLHASPMTEKITAARHANGVDIWVIAHEYNSNRYLSYLVSVTGVNPIPVVSAIGKVHFSISTSDAMSEMKISPDGKRLATVTMVQPDIEVFDFDQSTGVVSNRTVLVENGGRDSIGNAAGLYSCTFSPNSKVLYVGTLIAGNSPCQILQYDVSTHDSVLINASKTVVHSSNSRNGYSLKIGPNRKIYRAQNDNFLGVIKYPDSLGLACAYIHNGFSLPAGSGWGLNNVMEVESYCQPVGIGGSTQALDIVDIHPNPVQHLLQVDLPGNDVYALEIRDVQGRLMQKAADISGRWVVDCSGFAAGIYFIQAWDGITLSSRRFVKVDDGK